MLNVCWMIDGHCICTLKTSSIHRILPPPNLSCIFKGKTPCGACDCWCSQRTDVTTSIWCPSALEHLPEAAECTVCIGCKDKPLVTGKSRQYVFVKYLFLIYLGWTHWGSLANEKALSLLSVRWPSGWGSFCRNGYLWFMTLISKKIHLR